jgi:hypothetical protein
MTHSPRHLPGTALWVIGLVVLLAIVTLADGLGAGGLGVALTVGPLLVVAVTWRMLGRRAPGERVTLLDRGPVARLRARFSKGPGRTT